MGKYISKEILAEARKIEALSWLISNRYDRLVKVGNEYHLKDHDSFVLNKRGWYWNSRMKWSDNALDYLVEVEEMKLQDAVVELMGKQILEQKMPDVELPSANSNSNIAKKYLKERGISESVIDYFISEGTIYETRKYNNVIFLGMDEYGKPACATYRSTRPGTSYKGNTRGSKRKYAFRYENDESSTVHVFEGAIDLLSFITIMELRGKEWTGENYISTAGISAANDYSSNAIPSSLSRILESRNDMKKVVFHLDNDEPGKRAADAAIFSINRKYQDIVAENATPPEGKDYNEYLMLLKNRGGKPNEAYYQKTVLA